MVLPLIKIAFPFNVMAMTRLLGALSGMEFIPTEDITTDLLSLDHRQYNLGARWVALGYDTQNFILNSGTLFWTFVAFVITHILVCFLGKVFPRIKFYEKIKRALMWNMFLRLSLEAYLDLCINSTANLRQI